MAAQEVHGIVPGEASEIHDEPHIEGSRMTVWYVQQRVEERGLDPRTVADRHNLALADVYAALAYYHNNPAEMYAVKRRRQQAVEEAERRTTLEAPSQAELRRLLEDDEKAGPT